MRAPVGPGSGELTYNVDVLVDGELADPDEGFRVQLERPDGSRIVDETREDGTALFRGLVPGTYTVRAIGLSDEPEMVTRAQQVEVQDNAPPQRSRTAVVLKDYASRSPIRSPAGSATPVSTSSSGSSARNSRLRRSCSVSGTLACATSLRRTHSRRTRSCHTCLTPLARRLTRRRQTPSSTPTGLLEWSAR